MSDRPTFESQLRLALSAHVADAPVDVDPAAMAAFAAHARTQPWGALVRRRWSVPVLVGLLVALIGAALVAGGLVDRLPSILHRPATSDDLLLLMDMRRDPQDHACVDVRRVVLGSPARRQVISCADQIEFNHDGSRAAVGGLTGLSILDSHDGTKLADLPTGVWTRPVGWSPSSRWIQVAECTALPADVCKLVIIAADGSTRNEIPNVTDGGYSPAGWAPDESVLYPYTGQADPDGSNARPIPSDDPVANVDNLENWVRSPDGAPSSVAYTQGQGVWVRTRSDAGGRLLATVPDGYAIQTLSWSPDGQSIAAIEYSLGPDPSVVPSPVTHGRLRLIDVATGASPVLETPHLHNRQRDGFDLVWSPDGRRLAITTGNGVADATDDQYSSSYDTFIIAADGSAPAVFLPDARGVAWSLDGRSLAYIATTGSTLFHEGQSSPPTAIAVIDADGSGATIVIGPKEMVTPLGEPSAWFVWGVPAD